CTSAPRRKISSPRLCTGTIRRTASTSIDDCAVRTGALGRVPLTAVVTADRTTAVTAAIPVLARNSRTRNGPRTDQSRSGDLRVTMHPPTIPAGRNAQITLAIITMKKPGESVISSNNDGDAVASSDDAPKPKTARETAPTTSVPATQVAAIAASPAIARRREHRARIARA